MLAVRGKKVGACNESWTEFSPLSHAQCKKDAFSVSVVAWKGENIYLPSCGRADSKNNVPSQLGWQCEKRRSVHKN